MRALLRLALPLTLLAPWLHGQTLSRSVTVDFQRDVNSRNLSGLVARADGRLLSGPFLSELKGPTLGSLVWSLAPLPDGRWLVGTGPSGRIQRVTLDTGAGTYQLETYIDLPSNHIQALAVTASGDVLAGAGNGGALYLIRDGKLTARATLPVQAIHDIALDPAVPGRAYIATGNPAKVFRVDLAAFAAVPAAVAGQPAVDWSRQGITSFGEVKDRHLRRIAVAQGGLVGGSSPKGHLYKFSAEGGAGVIVMENKDAEVTSLLALPDGDLLATLVIAAPETENRINAGGTGNTPPAPNNAGGAQPGSPGQPGTPGAANPQQPQRPAPTPFDRFNGRSQLVRLPLRGAPEILAQRANTAFYEMALHGSTVIMAGGETGDLMGYDLQARLPLTLAGSPSAQLSRLARVAGQEAHLVLRNNPAGLSLLRDDAAKPRTVETKRIDLGATGLLGAWRPSRIRGVDTAVMTVEARLSRTADEAEGWTPWTKLTPAVDGWKAPGLVARHAKFKLTFPAGSTPAIDRAEVFLLPENRRPSLSDFKFLPPNFEIRPPVETPPQPPSTVGALMGDRNEGRGRTPLNNLQVDPSPGMQAVAWTMTDPDGDALAATLSIRPEEGGDWIDLAVDRRETFFQFSTSDLPEGTFITRIMIREQEPRPAAERLQYTAETDFLTIDRTPPKVIRSEVTYEGDFCVVTVEAEDRLSLLERLDVAFNRGAEETVSQPLDGVRDSRRETFQLRIPAGRIHGSTTLEAAVYDAVGNAVRLRLPVPPQPRG